MRGQKKQQRPCQHMAGIADEEPCGGREHDAPEHDPSFERNRIEIIVPRIDSERIDMAMQHILGQIVQRSARPLSVEPAVAQHPCADHQRERKQHARDHPPAPVEHQHPQTEAQQRESDLIARDESPAGQQAQSEPPTEHSPVTVGKQIKRNEQHQQVPRENLGTEPHMQIDQHPQPKAQPEKPVPPGRSEPSPANGRPSERPDGPHRKRTAEKPEQQSEQMRRIDAGK